MGLHRLMQTFAASPPGVWLFSRFLHPIDRVAFSLTGGRATLSSLFAGLPIAFVTTTGARSGAPRTVPLVAVPDPAGGAAIALVATNWGQSRLPAWYHNLRAQPRAHCRIGRREFAVRAREAQGEEYARYWAAATDIYLGYPAYRRRIGGRPIPIVVLEQCD